MNRSTTRTVEQEAIWQEAIWQAARSELDEYLSMWEIPRIKDPERLPRYLSHPSQEVRDKARSRLYELCEIEKTNNRNIEGPSGPGPSDDSKT